MSSESKWKDNLKDGIPNTHRKINTYTENHQDSWWLGMQYKVPAYSFFGTESICAYLHRYED